jgi:hypothetical protein
LQDAEEEPLTSSEEEEEELPSPQQRGASDASYQRLPSIIKTHLQLGRQSFNRTGLSIFELSRNSSILEGLQETLSQEAAAAPHISSPRLPSSSSRLFIPRVSATQLAALDSLSAAAAFSRSISLRHTPTLAQLPAPVQDVLESCGALFIEDGNIEGLAGEQQLGSELRSCLSPAPWLLFKHVVAITAQLLRAACGWHCHLQPSSSSPSRQVHHPSNRLCPALVSCTARARPALLPTEAASHFIAESGITETFYIYDLGEVARLHNTWRAAMPRVVPHYAGAGADAQCVAILTSLPLPCSK